MSPVRDSAILLVTMLVMLNSSGCAQQTNMSLVIKRVPDNQRSYPRDLIEKLPSDLQKAMLADRPTNTHTYAVFWRKESRAPKNEGARKLICSDGTEIQPRPMDFSIVLHAPFQEGGRPTGEEYTGAYFWVPYQKKPVKLAIQSRVFSLRWASPEEANRTGGWMDPYEVADESPRARIHARHIYIALTNNPPSGPVSRLSDADIKARDRELSDAYTKTETIMAEFARGRSFADLATQYSDCPSKERGGDLGWVSRGQMGKQWDDGVFRQKVGVLLTFRVFGGEHPGLEMVQLLEDE